MATDLKVNVRRQIDRLRKELNVATGQVAALRPGHVPEDLIQKKLDGTDEAEVSPVQWKYLETNKGQPP